MIELCPRLFPAFARFVVCENQKRTKEVKGKTYKKTSRKPNNSKRTKNKC